MIHKLVGYEQSVFLAGRTTHDKILTIQGIAHSLEYDAKSLPRMLLKVDIENAYNSIEWMIFLLS